MPQPIVQTIINESFSIVGYKQLISGLVTHEFYDEAKQIIYGSEVLKSVENIGTFQDDRFHNILVVEHSAGIGSRVKLATETFKLMAANNIDAALVAYHSGDNNLWRLSLVTLAFEENKSGRITRTFSNPRRYSYILGSSAKTVTPYKFLISKGKTSGFDDLISRFSLEVVNSEFYREIAKLYDELIGTDTKPAVIRYPGNVEASHQFAVRLIGRIVFCWFLREKHSAAGMPLIDKSVLSRETASEDNYYHNTLAPLFFEILNKPVPNRSERFQVDYFGKIPYLNGGLFAPQTDDHYKYDNILAQSVPGQVNVPDSWLRKLLDLLELYHFTVDENTSVDIDLSIDPEMLGRIFENLLARINPETGETVRKSTGSFYTPREIVEYMVDESLLQYLKNITKISEQNLRALITYDLVDDKDYSLDDAQKNEIVAAISELKVLDPACGSGAFPIGMLQKVVFILQQIDPEARLWFENQIVDTAPEVRRLIEREFQHKNFDYIRKLGVIRESIFGIDIQPIATEIARLRCFLTLIVDERVDDNVANRGIYPLPNLDFKFVTANTLIPVPEQKLFSGEVQQDLFDSNQYEKIERLRLLRNDYFNAHSSERSEIKSEFRLTQNELWMAMHSSSSYGQQSLALSGWDPFSNKSTEWFDTEWMFGINDGFDIVIGNPPYYKENDDKTRFEGLRELECYQGKMDVWYLFGGFGLDALKANGILCYIATNNWTTNAGASKFRNKILVDAKIISLIDFGNYRVFESAAIQTMVMVFERQKDDNYTFDYRRIRTVKPFKSHFRDLLSESVNSENEYLKPMISNNELKNKLFTFSDAKSTAVLKSIVAHGDTKLFAKEVAQGIVFPQDYVNKKSHAKLLGSHAVGAGVFVLNQSEKNSMKLSPTEHALIKPYFTSKQLGRYHSSPINSEWVIYTDSNYRDSINMEPLPALKKHLDQFAEIITSANHPYGLHRAREQSFFTGKKIMSLRKSPSLPAFTYTDFDCYVSAAFYIIKSERLDMKYLTGLLNSKLVAFWLKNRGKMQGSNYQIDKEPLLTIPIASGNKQLQEQIIIIVNSIYEKNQTDKIKEAEIDRLVYELYDLTNDDIAVIEEAIR